MVSFEKGGSLGRDDGSFEKGGGVRWEQMGVRLKRGVRTNPPNPPWLRAWFMVLLNTYYLSHK